MITDPTEEGGAEVTFNHGEWKNVTAIFPVHDVETNNTWMRDWSKKTFLSDDDLDQIRNKFGESVRTEPALFLPVPLTSVICRLRFTLHFCSLISGS